MDVGAVDGVVEGVGVVGGVVVGVCVETPLFKTLIPL